MNKPHPTLVLALQIVERWLRSVSKRPCILICALSSTLPGLAELPEHEFLSLGPSLPSWLVALNLTDRELIQISRVIGARV